MTRQFRGLAPDGATELEGLREPLATSLGVAAESLHVTLVYRGNLADSSSILLASTGRGQVLGAVLWSPEAAPDAVALSMAKAAAAHAVLPPELAMRVLVARAEGRVAGRSFAVVPYCKPLARFRPLWWLQRPSVREVVLGWLRGVCRATAHPVPAEELATAFQRPLARLAAAEAAPQELRDLGRAALDRLGTGHWTPRCVLMHGDLWQGNLMVRAPAGPDGAHWAQRVCLIDWGASQPRGHALFDLVRAADALRLAPARLRQEVALHCQALGCEPRDAASYLAAALAHVHANLGEFPLPRFIAMAEGCRRTLLQAAAAP